MGYADGKASAFRGQRYVGRWHRGDDYADAFASGYNRVVSA